MTTIAIIGAGPGLGAAGAQTFGAQGFDIALISRTRANVDALAEDLQTQGFSARGYAANVREPQSLTAALDQAAQELGPIEVVQYSPIPQKEFLRPVLETTAEDLGAALEFSLFGPVAMVQQVLPGMRALGRGSILFVNGGSAVRPNPKVAGTSTAFAAESAYAQMLHHQLGAENILVSQLIVPGAIKPGDPNNAPEKLAARLWDLHTRRTEFRVFSEAMPAS